jgi:hypothetical protein
MQMKCEHGPWPLGLYNCGFFAQSGQRTCDLSIFQLFSPADCSATAAPQLLESETVFTTTLYYLLNLLMRPIIKSVMLH